MQTDRPTLVRIVCSAFVLLGLGAGTARAMAADEPDANVAARLKWQTQVASRKPADRVEAFQHLRDCPSAEVAKLIVTRGLNDREEDVRRAAETALMAMKDNAAVCNYFVDSLAKEAKRKGAPDPSLAVVIRMMIASTLPAAGDAVMGYLDKSTSSAPEAVASLSAYVDEIGNKAAPADLAQLARISKSKTFEREFGLQRAVVQAARKYKTKEAVALIISLLDKQKGELRSDILAYLEEIAGVSFGPDAPAWRKWWKEHEENFEFPKNPVAKVDQEVAGGDNEGGSYYGIPLYAKRMVFVIDTSNSMHGDRIVAAKRDLVRAVNELDKDRFFSIVAFNSSPYVWRKTLVAANESNKRDAEYWIEEQQLALGTASYDALEAAMQFDAEAVYFLTDGAPAGGKIVEPNAIVAAITQLNRVRRESIYSIGIGMGHAKKKAGKAKGGGGRHENFLQSLSSQNYGIYRRVDE